MEQAIEVLRVEQKGISKELNTFRACDSETRSLYCRDWAQYIYKKHFVWNAKTQEDVITPDQQRANTVHTVKAGKYQINFLPTTKISHHDEDDQQEEEEEEEEELNVMKKEDSFALGKKFGDLAASWTSADSTSADQQSLLIQIMEACQLWMTLPSGYSGLPDCFEPVEFNPYPDAIPLVDDVKDPSQLLDPLIIERQALCLPSDCFHLLKNLTGDILLSHTTPTCGHSKPDSKTPADLEVDRAIFNEHEQTAVTQALKELALALETAWYPLNQFLKQLTDLEKRRAHLMGKGCQANVDQFFSSQKYVSFVDRWTNDEASQFKNKKSTEEEVNKVDTLLENHLDGLKKLVRDFMSDFVPKILEEIHALTTDLWKMVIPTYTELRDRMAKREAKKRGTSSPPKSLVDMETLKKMEFTKEVDAAKQRITADLNTKVEEYFMEIDALFKLYKESARPNLSGRLEKLNNKEFKKKIKKVESGYYSLRQMFRYEVTEKIFPESLFCKFALVCLQPLLKEGEMVEALTIETEVKRFLEAYKDLWRQRSQLLHRFEQGVQTGRRELAGVLGKLFLKEGMRIQGDNLALKRQNSLLKSMGVDVDATSASESSKKSKKKKSSGGSGSSTPAQQPEIDSPSASKSTMDKRKNGSVPSSPVTPTSEKKAVVNNKAVKTITPTKPAPPVKVLNIASSPKVDSPPVSAESPVAVKSPSPPPIKPVIPSPVNKAPSPPGLAVKAPPPPALDAKVAVEPVKKIEEVKKVEQVEKVVEKPKKVVVVEEPKKCVKEPLFVYEEHRTPPKPKVKSSKIPAPMPIIEKVEPKVTLSSSKKKSNSEKSKKKESKKEESPAVAPVGVAVEPVVVVQDVKKEEDEKTAVVDDVKKEVDTQDDVQDWESIRASVTSTPTAKKDQQVEQQSWNDIVKQVENDNVVQDWNDIRAEVVKEEEKVASVVKTGELGGWSTVAAKKHISVETNWSSTSTPNAAAEVNATDEWGSTPTKALTNKVAAAASPALSTTSSAAWSTTATIGGAAGNTGGWGASPAVTNTEKTSTGSSNGWNASPVVEKSTLSTGWGSPAETKPAVSAPLGWSSSPVVASSAASTTGAGGNEWSTNTEQDSSLNSGWGKPSISASWGSKKTSSHHQMSSSGSSSATGTPTWNTNVSTPAPARPANGGWDNTQMLWNGEPSASVTTSKPQQQQQQQQAPVARGPAPGLQQQQPQQQEIVKAALAPVAAVSAPTSTRPPGPPGLSIANALEKQLTNAPSLLTSITPTSTSAVTTTTTTPTTPGGGLLGQAQPQAYQESLPANLHDLGAEMLILITQNLHRENAQLIQSVYTMQQEMSMMTSRYAEIMALAREREAQNLSLFESRKQTEMEDVKRYVLALEARIKQMEGAQTQQGATTTAGFGNQDLFAGYREEMRSSGSANSDYNNNGQQQQHHGQHGERGRYHKKLWQKNNPIIRCGNCGEMGHESAECKTDCRYCGSSEHLSEACPMN